MKVNDLKDLQKLLQLCQKTGVEEMEVDGMKFKLSPLLKKTRNSFNKGDEVNDMFPEASMHIPNYNPPQTPITAPDNIKTETISEEQMLMWSVAGEQNS